MPHDIKITLLAESIKLDSHNDKHDMVFLGNGTNVKMSTITQKELYEDAILRISRFHIHETKWIEKLNTIFLPEEVWSSVHNTLSI